MNLAPSSPLIIAFITLLLLLVTTRSQGVPQLQDFFNRILPNEAPQETFD